MSFLGRCELQAEHSAMICPKTTQLLTIEPLAESDQSLFEALYCNTTTMQNIAAPYTPEQIPAMFQRCRRASQKKGSERHFYTLKSKADRNSVGMISRVPTGFPQAPAELGIMLMAKVRGTGCADEALASLCLYCLEQLQMPAVMVRCHPQNKGACQLNIRLGFTAAPEELQDQSGLLCWWMPNTPKQQAHLMHICTGLRSNQLSREVF